MRSATNMGQGYVLGNKTETASRESFVWMLSSMATVVITWAQPSMHGHQIYAGGCPRWPRRSRFEDCDCLGIQGQSSSHAWCTAYLDLGERSCDLMCSVLLRGQGGGGSVLTIGNGFFDHPSAQFSILLVWRSCLVGIAHQYVTDLFGSRGRKYLLPQRG